MIGRGGVASSGESDTANGTLVPWSPVTEAYADGERIDVGATLSCHDRPTSDNTAGNLILASYGGPKAPPGQEGWCTRSLDSSGRPDLNIPSRGATLNNDLAASRRPLTHEQAPVSDAFPIVQEN